MLSFDVVFAEVMDRLTAQLSNPQILSILGSSGIVKNKSPEIWEMSKLRHLEIACWFRFRFFLPDPPNVPLIIEGDDFILRNSVSGDDEGWWHNYCLNNLGLLNKLESLYISCSYVSEPSFQIEFVQNFPFPNSLKKLTLFKTNFHWEDMRMICSLPHLQVLKLRMNSFRGPEWNPVEGEFLCLKFLEIDFCNDLVHWNANRSHFPCLEKLVLNFMYNLKEIPLDIGEIPTLRFIGLWGCSNSVVLSARNLLDEQVGLGNEDLQVRILN